jgi:hypothetical protein
VCAEKNILLKRDEMIGSQRKLHTEDLHNLFSFPSMNRMMKSRKMRCSRHVARMGEEKNVYRIFMGKLKGRKTLGRCKCRLVDNIKMDLREMGWHDMYWFDLDQDRVQQRAL